MKEGSLLYFPDGAAKMTRADRDSFGSSSQLAEPLVAIGAVAKVVDMNDRNALLRTGERQLQGPIPGRFESEARLPLSDIVRFAQPLITFDELADSKETILYQTWKQSQELRKVFVPVEIFVSETHTKAEVANLMPTASK